MVTSKNEYVPGVCNIGREETRLRWIFGWVSAILSVILLALLVGLKAAPAWRLVIALPATLAAIGFLQAAWHFCAKFGLAGVFNFGPNVGRTDTVEQAEFRRQDRRTAIKIIVLSLLAGVLVALASFFIPL